MAVIKQSVIVSYTSAEMYGLVNDIEHYPEFLPWCKSTTVHVRNQDEVQATVCLAKGAMQHSFTTLNRLSQNKMIEVRLLNGPFRHLEGFWRFDPEGNNRCRVSFDLEFEFSNKLVDLTAGPVLQKIAESFVEAFCKRAKEVYG